jgi:hypothetical protein
MSLRTEAIEAMGPGPKGYLSDPADVVLDKLLGFLSEHPDEWVHEVEVMDEINSPPHNWELIEPVNPFWLLAALREGTK